MLKLAGIAINSASAPSNRQLLSVSTNPNIPEVLRQQKAFLVDGLRPVPEGFQHYLCLNEAPDGLPANAAMTVLPSDFSYLGHDDVVRVGGGRVRSLFRAASRSNSVLLTERCNNYCLMCSQPPKQADDSWLLQETMDLIRLIPQNTGSLGFTGGEPTLYGQGFIDLLKLAKSRLPHTSLHVLSNGRSFKDESFAKVYAQVQHPDLMVGIPVYSADPVVHDYVVQAEGAFDETIRGILNLKRHGQRVEIRVVLHQQTIGGLAHLAEYICRNLLFVDQVALMGLEMMGFTRANFDALWIDPDDYRAMLSEAVAVFRNHGVRVLVYNHPLCLVNEDIGPHYVKSISDWKNEFAPECAGCTRQQDCGGFFSSGIKHHYSKSLRPFV
jgi:His-Xaa-Ser system radical SAM maturase HxsC